MLPNLLTVSPLPTQVALFFSRAFADRNCWVGAGPTIFKNIGVYFAYHLRVMRMG